jgi:hypothetical protein
MKNIHTKDTTNGTNDTIDGTNKQNGKNGSHSHLTLDERLQL